MDINLNRIEPSRQVGNVDRTKRVRKPNKDEAEQDGKRFKEQLDLASGEDNQEEPSDEKPQKKQSNPKTDSKQENKQLPPPEDDDEKVIGGNLDITV